MAKIKFWRVRDKWGEFSNFYVRPIVVDGQKYKSTEHYFQAWKFLPGTMAVVEDDGIPVDVHEHVRNQPSPRQAADEGRRKDLPLRADWDQPDPENPKILVKDGVMVKALYAKFTQHPDLTVLLLSTGDAQIIEDSPKDSYWGCGADGKGKDMLGFLLMAIRERLETDMDISPAGLIAIEEHLTEMAKTETRLSTIGALGLIGHIRLLQGKLANYKRIYDE